MRNVVVQEIIKTVVSSDKDNDLKISKLESHMLALKIRVQLQEHGIDFNERMFLKVLGKDPSVSRVISIVQKLYVVRNNADDEESENEDFNAEEMEEIRGMFTWQNDDDPENQESLMEPTNREKRLSRRKTRLSERTLRVYERDESVISRTTR